MAIESAAFLRRFARTECLVLLLVIVLCVAAAAQAPVPSVVSGSVIPIQHDQWGQIYHIVIASTGDVLFLDTQNGALYQMLPDGTITTISSPGAVLKGGGNFWNTGMAIDSHDTIYITNRWQSDAHFYRVPYDSANKTWPLTASSNWGASIGGGLNTNDIAIDDSNNLVVTLETQKGIVRIRVDASGNPVGEPEFVVTGLKSTPVKVAVDHLGNIFFIENCWPQSYTDVAHGVWMLPASTTGLVGNGTGSLEAEGSTARTSGALVRIDPYTTPDTPGGDRFNFKGITFDSANDAYLASQVDTYGGNTDMILMVPRADIVAAQGGDRSWLHAVMLAPVSATAAVTLDPRGYLWIPTPTNGWVPTGDLAIPGTLNFAKYALGTADLGTSPVETPSSTAVVYYSFSANTTIGSVVFTQPNGGSDFGPAATDPNTDPEATTPAVACAAGAYAAGSYCPVWLNMTPSVAGSDIGQVQLRNASNAIIANSETFLHGIGQAPAISILNPSNPVPSGPTFTTPRQVAADTAGYIYVADSGARQVVKYARGSSTSTTVGTGLVAPTGVAVDTLGNVFIGDSGNILKVPYSGAQGIIQTGLGANLNLTVDGSGSLYVADPDNHRVIKIPNATTKVIQPNQIVTVGSGFTQPSAVAVDGAGNLFVADQSNLYQVTATGSQKGITTALAGGVTGLAIDASGSVYVAQSSGPIRIPTTVSGSLSVTDAVSLSDAISSPSGIALDYGGRVFLSHGTAVSQLGIDGAIDFGTVPTNAESDAQAQIFNVGNLPLTFSPFGSPSGPNAADFAVTDPDDSPACSPATPARAGTHCWLGVYLMASSEGNRTATLAIQSDAVNAASVNLALAGTTFNDSRTETTTTLTYSPSQLTYPANATVTVTVSSTSGTPDGEVIVSLSGRPKVTANLQSGVASIPYTALNGGAYTARASYGGSGSTFGASSGKTTFTVNRATSSTAITIPSSCVVENVCYIKNGNSVTLTATVTSTAGTPTGEVVFMENGAVADSSQPTSPVDSHGVAHFNTANLAQGVHAITAVYQSDMNFAVSTSTSASVQILDPIVLITGSSLTVTRGTPKATMLTLTSIVGFNDTVQLECFNLPNYSECTFANPQPKVEGGKDPKLIGVTLSTNVPVNVASSRSNSLWGFAGMFAVGLVGLVLGKKTKYNGRALVIFCALLLITGAVVGISACSNSGYTQTPQAPHVETPTGTYAVGIRAISPTTRQVVSLPYTMNVTVQ